MRPTAPLLALVSALSCAGQNAGPAPAAPRVPATTKHSDQTIVLDGVPEIPPELRDRMMQYLNVRSASLNALSDDGSSVLVTTRFASTRQVHLVKAPLGSRHQLTFASNPVRNASFAPNSKDTVLFMSDEGGNERYQVYRLNLTDGKSLLVTDGKSRHNRYIWSFKGDRIAFTNNARNGKDMDLYVSDGTSSSSAEILLEREGYWFPIEWSRDGKQLLIRHYVSVVDSRIYVVDIATKKVTRISPEQPVAAYRSAVFGETPGTLYVTTDKGGEFVHLYLVELATATWTALSSDIPWNVEEIVLSADGKTLAFVTNEEGYSVLYLLDTKTKKRRIVKDLPQGIMYGLVFARKANILGFTLNGASRTSDAYSYVLSKRRLVRWTESEVGGLSSSSFIEPKLLKYETFDKKKIPVFYYRPAGKGPFPVVVKIHGGPESQARPWFSPLTQYMLVEMGIAVLVPNVRGSNGYGKSYVGLDNGFKREDSVKDIGALLDWIATRPELDKERVAVYGGSYGGYMVLASLVHFGDRLRAGAEIVGISNFVTFLENTSDYRRDLRRAEYGDERDPKMRSFLTEISPTTNIKRIKSALYVAQGANDPRVPASESEQIVRAVRSAGHDVWYMLATNEGHGFRRKENRDQHALLVAKFLETHLLR